MRSAHDRAGEQNLDNHFDGKPVVSPVPELRDMAANAAGRLR